MQTARAGWGRADWLSIGCWKTLALLLLFFSLLEVMTARGELTECSKLTCFAKRMLDMVPGDSGKESEIDDRCRQLVLSGIDVDNLQNYCLGTRYGARSRSRLCRRLSISLVRYRHGLEQFLEHHFIPIRRRFNLHDLPTDLLRVQDPFFRTRRPIFSTGNDRALPAMGTPSMAWHVLFLCGRSSLI